MFKNRIYFTLNAVDTRWVIVHKLGMNETDRELFDTILRTQTETFKEERMAAFLADYGRAKGWNVYNDKHHNVVLSKDNGSGDAFPMVAAHIDSVQPVDREIFTRWNGKKVTAEDKTGRQIGFGADDKTGIFVCLKLMDEFDHIQAGLFSGEEVGCQGASRIDKKIMDRTGYIIEWDCPSKGMMSYTSSGIRIFDNDSEFINIALPALDKHDVEWQNHPYTDIRALVPRFNLSALNISSGYYNWHAPTEYVVLSEVLEAVTLGKRLVADLGTKKYPFNPKRTNESQPLREIKPLRVR